MLNASEITTAEQLAEALAHCGLTSVSPDSARSWTFWKNEWRSKELSLSRYLTDFPNDEFFVVVNKDTLEVYVQDRQNFWFHKIGEMRGDTSEQEFCMMIRRTISGETSE